MSNLALNENQIKMLKNCGALGYPASKIASVMELPIKVIEDGLGDKESDISKAYQAGIDYADYVIDLKLFDLARQGDIKAMDKLEKRKLELKRKDLYK